MPVRAMLGSHIKSSNSGKAPLTGSKKRSHLHLLCVEGAICREHPSISSACAKPRGYEAMQVCVRRQRNPSAKNSACEPNGQEVTSTDRFVY